jgi:hypothetical protein
MRTDTRPGTVIDGDDDDLAGEAAGDHEPDQELDQDEQERRTVGDWVADGLLGVVDDAVRDARATVWRLRRQLMPHAVTGAVLGAGFAAQAVTAEGKPAPAQAAMVIALTAVPAAFGLARWVRRRRRRWARRVLWGGVGAAVWLSLSPFGVGPHQVTELVCLEVALAARWWQTHRLGYPSPVEEPAPAAEPEPEPAPTRDQQIITDWRIWNSCQGGPTPGSALFNPEETRYGYAFALQLARSRQVLDDALRAIGKIASGLEVDVTDLLLEAHPGLLVDDGAGGQKLVKSPSLCRLQVITDSPIKGAVNFTGPRRRGGMLELGPHADGDGEAPYRLYTPGSMWSGVIIGGTGIGKSRVAENIVISAISGGDTEFWFCDPQGGVSSPALARHADWFVGAGQADLMLEAALAILEARGDENAVEGWTGFTPSPARPGLLIVVEECHTPFSGSDRGKKWGRVAREGRKLGVALLVIDQYPGLETFGNHEPLRSSVMEGNVLVLRSTSNQTGQLMAGLQVNPKELPKIPGYAYVQGSEETGIRTAPFRNRDTDPDDPELAAELGLRPGQSVADYWLARQPRPGLDTLAATATRVASDAYARRHASHSGGGSGQSASAARVEALRHGQVPATPKPRPAAAGAAGTAQRGIGPMGTLVRFPSWPPTPAAGGGAAPAASRQATPQPPASDATTAAPAAPAAAAGPAAARPTTPQPELPGSHRAVLDAVAAGHTKPKNIREETGLSHRRVHEILKDLLRDGHLTQPEHGQYRAARAA